ncbi:MAG: hypothetical protein ACI9HK_001760 [Pirellulaceae bacterium]|jgi:uncharacterized protein YjbI with pentapeptide repeats
MSSERKRSERKNVELSSVELSSVELSGVELSGVELSREPTAAQRSIQRGESFAETFDCAETEGFETEGLQDAKFSFIAYFRTVVTDRQLRVSLLQIALVRQATR